MIIGVGIDVAEIERFAASVQRTPALLDRLFVPAELVTPSGDRRGPASLAARFAAKEAVAKALGAAGGAALDGLRGVRRGHRAAPVAGARDGGGAGGGAGGDRVACVAQSRRGSGVRRGDRGRLRPCDMPTACKPSVLPRVS